MKEQLQEQLFALRARQSECPLAERADIQREIVVVLWWLDQLEIKS